MRQVEYIKCIKIGKKGPFFGDMILSLKDPAESTRKLRSDKQFYGRGILNMQKSVILVMNRCLNG